MKENFEQQPTREEQIKRIKDLRAEIFSGLKMMEAYEELTQIARSLEKKHPDYKEYFLYHALVGGTPPSYATKPGMPGNESAEDILNRIAEKYPPETEKK